MSRGHGKVQRAVLDALRASQWGQARPSGIAAAVYGPEPTDAQRSAVRRAIRGLVAEGLVHKRMGGSEDSRPRTYQRRYGKPFQKDDGRWYRRAHTLTVGIHESVIFLRDDLLSDDQRAAVTEHRAATERLIALYRARRG